MIAAKENRVRANVFKIVFVHSFLSLLSLNVVAVIWPNDFFPTWSQWIVVLFLGILFYIIKWWHIFYPANGLMSIMFLNMTLGAAAQQNGYSCYIQILTITTIFSFAFWLHFALCPSQYKGHIFTVFMVIPLLANLLRLLSLSIEEDKHDHDVQKYARRNMYFSVGVGIYIWWLLLLFVERKLLILEYSPAVAFHITNEFYDRLLFFWVPNL